MKHRRPKAKPLPAKAGLADRPAGTPSSRARVRVFRLVALVAPVLLLLILEIGLRIFGAGNPTKFFLSLRQHGELRLVENARFGWRYFPPALSRSPVPFSLPARKPPGTYRIFVLGESAAMGDPEPAYGLSRQLERLLQARRPDKKFEVINVAMTAINSHVIRDIARDCCNADGDCWIIYAGNNEVVGPFGAGTVFGKQAASLPAARLVLAVKSTRIGQLLAGMFKPKGVPVEWQGMEMFLGQQVRSEDPRLSRVYTNFARNLEAIVKFGKRSGAAVIAVSMAVNLKDCPPFASSHRPGLSVIEQAEWQKFFEAGRTAQREGRYAEALEAYDRAAQIDAEYAELLFLRGACKATCGDTAGAEADFALARDLDVLRFRADSRLNAIVRQVASTTGIRLIDAEQDSRRSSLPGVPGDELFYDHVHLNFAGTYWLATQLLPEVENALFPTSVSAKGPVLNEAELSERLAFTQYDQRLVFEEMRARLQQPPFSTQANAQERDALWKSRLAALATQPQPSIEPYATALKLAPNDWVLHARLGQLLEAADDQAAAAAHWRKVADQMPHEPEAFFHLGNLAQSGGAYEEAEQLFRQALEKRPESPEALNGLGLVMRARGQVSEARRFFEQALELNPRYTNARINLAVLLADSGRAHEAKKHYVTLLRAHTNNVPARINLAKLLAAEGSPAEAIRLYQEAVTLDPQNATAHYNLANVLCAQRKFSDAIPHYFAAVQVKPDFVEARYNLGLELARAERLSEAAEQFAEVVRLQPRHAEAHFNYGVALARQKRFDEAVREFKETLSLQPAHPSAGEMLQRALRLSGGEGG